MVGITWECWSIRLRQGSGETGLSDGVMKKQPTNTLFYHAGHMVNLLSVDDFLLYHFRGGLFQYSSTPILHCQLSITILEKANEL
jgi:hypothetical protein